MGNGKRNTYNGKREMENGKWEWENGKRKMEIVSPITYPQPSINIHYPKPNPNPNLQSIFNIHHPSISVIQISISPSPITPTLCAPSTIPASCLV